MWAQYLVLSLAALWHVESSQIRECEDEGKERDGHEIRSWRSRKDQGKGMGGRAGVTQKKTASSSNTGVKEVRIDEELCGFAGVVN